MSRGVRVYLPATLAGLGTLSAGGTVAGRAFAVTDRLRAAAGPAAAEGGDPGDPAGELADELADELAEAALIAAADASLELLAAAPADPPRRVVVAAVVPVRDGPAEPGDHPAAVSCTRPVGRADVASVLVDDAASGPAVAAAVAALRTGDEAAFEAARDELDGHVLSWYDAGELDGLARERTGAPTPTRDLTEGQHP